MEELYHCIREKLSHRRRMTFRGKNAVVTGGAGGIGLQVARQLLTAGAAVSGASKALST